MRREKKRAAALLAVLLCTSQLSGCTGTGDAHWVEQTNGQLRIYLAPGIGSRYSEAVSRYRELHPELELVVEDRSGGELGSDAETVRAELMAGRGPDILFEPNRYFDDVFKTAASGIFVDLLPYFDADPDFHREDYFENILFGLQDGGYVVPLAYDVDCLLTTREAVKEAGIDLARCQTDCLSLLAEARAYTARGQTPALFNRPAYGRYYPEFLGLPFLDYKRGTADFSDPVFAEAAALYRDFYPQDMKRPPAQNDMLAASLDILERRAVFSPVNAGVVHVGALSVSILSERETPVLFPVRAQDGSCFAWIQESAAVCAASPNRQNAYAFIRYLLSPAWQNSLAAYLNFPVLRAGMAHREEEGRNVTDGGVLEGETPLPLAPLADSFYSELTAMAENVGHVGYKNGLLCDAVEQYLEPFYQGQKSFDACLSELQGAMEIYLTE